MSCWMCEDSILFLRYIDTRKKEKKKKTSTYRHYMLLQTSKQDTHYQYRILLHTINFFFFLSLSSLLHIVVLRFFIFLSVHSLLILVNAVYIFFVFGVIFLLCVILLSKKKNFFFYFSRFGELYVLSVWFHYVSVAYFDGVSS